MPTVQALPNLLIVSDLHLGEDLRPATRTGYLRHVAMLERELEAFLDHHAKVRLDGRRWRLVVNGDMVDFLSVCLMPREMAADASLGNIETDRDERVYGLGTRPAAARAKMRRVLLRHPGVFRALARFIGAGNCLSIVVGNHDVEFHWPAVQEAFKEGVAALWAQAAEARRAGAPGPAEIEAAISFHPWFFFEENVAWIEHGHQYDDYCSFDYVLNPVGPRGQEILMTVAAAGTRYVSNHVAGAEPHQQEDWSAAGYFRWAIAHGARGAAKIARSYAVMAWRLLTLWRIFTRRPSASEASRTTHLARLSELAAQVKLSEETLVALDALRRRPVITNLAKLAGALFIDRLLVGVVTAIAIMVLVLSLPWTWALGAVAAAVAGAWALGARLSGARESVNAAAKLRAVTQRIRALVRAPFVVFGHTHEPQAVKLDDGGWYFNTGTWVATEKPGLLRSFTHVLIRHDVDGPHAELRQWRDGRSQTFVPEAK